MKKLNGDNIIDWTAAGTASLCLVCLALGVARPDHEEQPHTHVHTDAGAYVGSDSTLTMGTTTATVVSSSFGVHSHPPDLPPLSF